MPATSAPSSRSLLGALLTCLTLTLLLSVGLAPAAQAHNTLISSSPKDGATLDALPEEVVLTFNDDVIEGGNGIVVTGPDGVDHAEGEISVDGPTASVALAPLSQPGEYTIEYRIVSADGHPLSDTLTFTLDESALPDPAEARPTAEAQPTAEEAETEPADSVEEEAATDLRSLAGPFAPVLGVLVAIGGIAVIAIIVIRLRRRSGSGE
ncbi:copper resistance protein CopC [Thermobifida halotolerans]|uniref:Copper resistance protein CopC n=1 Tax=Thermobifida halotolerans TaxID=483545 RepID=A0A399FYU2_9ACTN|nr:copper resistance CopC family protein [Thermobifida halotolerans]UOE19366.1 copper resistance protein CopC [Thermobifida halotolerans]